MTDSTIDEIAKAIGLTAAIRFCRAYGSTKIRVPTSVSISHPICVAIGLKAATALCSEFAGVTIDVPSEQTALMARRNEIICREYLNGKSVRKIAKENNLSRKRIHKILDAGGIVRTTSGSGHTPQAGKGRGSLSQPQYGEPQCAVT